MTAVDQQVEKLVETPDTRLVQIRRVTAAATAFVAPWGFVVANAGYTWATRNGGSDESGDAALALTAPQPDLMRLIVVAGLLGCVLFVPAVVTAMRLAQRSWLAFIGGSLMVAGYVCYFGVLLSNMIIIAMAERGGPVADFGAAIDAGQADPTTSWVFLLFVAGNLLGTLIFALGLWRSKTVPAWAAILILAWPPLHVIGLVVGSEVFEVTGAVLQAVGFAAIGAVVLRRGPAQLPKHSGHG